MHVHFLGEPDNGISVSAQHARALTASGATATFDAPDPRNASARSADVIHLVTYAQTDYALLRRLIGARKAGQPIVRYWTGKDVLWARYHWPTRRFAHVLGRLGAVQLAPTASLVEQLARIGVAASLGPIVNPDLSSAIEPEPLPATFSVLSYLPSERREFHGGPIVDHLIRCFPDVRFLILGDALTNYSALPNVEALPFIHNVSRTIRRASITVQPRRDGELSRLVLETLCEGRHAITTAQLPCCHHATTAAEYVTTLRRLWQEIAFNLEGREWVCRTHDCARSLAGFRRILEKCIQTGPLPLKLQGRWLAAMVTMRHPSVYSRKPFPPLDAASLPPDAAAMRALISAPSLAGVENASLT